MGRLGILRTLDQGLGSSGGCDQIGGQRRDHGNLQGFTPATVIPMRLSAEHWLGQRADECLWLIFTNLWRKHHRPQRAD
jgi:hypothetical protein